MNQEQRTGRRILGAILLALGVWGFLLALGAYLGLWHREGEGLRDIRRFWIVIGIVGIFLTCWLAALAVRARRSKHQEAAERPHPRDG